MQILLSLPPAIVRDFSRLENKCLPDWVPVCDPAGMKLGSGGGTANLLVEAWRQTGQNCSFREWLKQSKKLVIHSGGQSRRLPAYGHCGKALIPIPIFRWAKGQQLEQTLLDLQLPFYRRVLEQSPDKTVVMVTSGDVFLQTTDAPLTLPDDDVVCLGQWVQPEEAARHGVFINKLNQQDRLSFFLQKPSVERIRHLAADHLFMMDTGIWLLSMDALKNLMEKSGWNWDKECYQYGKPTYYDLYGDFGLGLGETPTVPDNNVSLLATSVIPLPDSKFYHFGVSRDLIQSCSRLQELVLDQRDLSVTAIKPHSNMYVQNAPLLLQLKPENKTLWVENATLPPTWKLSCEHVVTGIPDNRWDIELPRGICIDMVPIDASACCIRTYGIDDPFRGRIGDDTTLWCGGTVLDWLTQRTLGFRDLDIPADTDIQDAALFPVVDGAELEEAYIQWLIDPNRTGPHPEFAERWLNGHRLSASQLSEQANLKRLYDQRQAYRRNALLALARNWERSVFYSLDLGHTAIEYAASDNELPPAPPPSAPLMQQVHHKMFAAAVRRNRKQKSWEQDEQAAFQLLRNEIIESTRQTRIRPVRCILDDQILWGRAPIRLDLAGGWTDTPPYCLIHGGRVVNVAVNLNGQPPIQTYVRISEAHHIVLRSIDLGIEERITNFDQLRDYSSVGSGFSIAKAALALAGFLPEFTEPPGSKSLGKQLAAFGGGIEISLLAAVPKGSGLGTSSILAATLLGTLGNLCGLKWDHAEICRRTLTLEQMLTTGGGWQDQIGGMVRGLKLIETKPGIVQNPVIRWIPDHLFSDPVAKNSILLYYTGITRIAKGILKEIVRGMFLNSAQHTTILRELGSHAIDTCDVLIRNDWDGLCRSIRRSWDLNQRLDSGTNPSPIQAIIDQVQDYLAATKLLGAGGGGYMLMLAKDPDAAVRIRQILAESPSSPKARFVDFDVSRTGLEVTRS